MTPSHGFRFRRLSLALLTPAAFVAVAAGVVTPPSPASAAPPKLHERIVIGTDLDTDETPTGRDRRGATGTDAWFEVDRGIEGSIDVDFQRVDGLTLGFGQRFSGEGRYGPTLELREARAFNRGRWLFDAELEQPLIPDHLSIGGGFFRRTALFDGLDAEIVSDEENFLAALLIKEDYRDYFEEEGVQGYLQQRFNPRTGMRATVIRSRHRPLENSTRTSLTRWNDDFRRNPAAVEGDFRALRLSFEYDTRPAHRSPTMAEWARVEWERADGGLGGDFDYARLLTDARQYLRTSPGQQLSWRVIYGTTPSGRLPAQKQFAIGGVGTLRAHSFKEFIGDELLLGNVEYRFDIDSSFEAIVFMDSGATAPNGASLRDQEFALDGGFGFGSHGDRAAVYVARDLKRSQAKLRVSFRLAAAF